LIRVLQPGLLTTVQDLGRTGFRKYGVVVGGAVDTFSHTIANWLVNNPASAATLEMTLLGAELAFERTTLIALCGGTVDVHVNGDPAPMWRPVAIPAGAVLRVGAVRRGCRVYLAVDGGFDVPKQMASRSTNLRARFGGFRGRALRVGDVLTVGADDGEDSCRTTALAMSWMEGADASGRAVWPPWGVSQRWVAEVLFGPFRAMPGEHMKWLAPDARHHLWDQAWIVSQRADRMGVRLEGPSLTFAEFQELVSEAVVPGTVQLPAGGQPILLLADSQTTGGYPRILHVASADLPKAGQLRPGEHIRFAPIDVGEAHRLLCARHRELRALMLMLQQSFTKGC
jgi:antagonist of KipI